MNTAYLSALSALAGSVIGGVTMGITTWMALRAGARAGHRAAELARRQELFREFIVTASKAYGNALVSHDPQIQELVALHAMISRMRILCSPEIVTCAEKVVRLTIETYFTSNKTIAELREMIRSETLIDPLKEFSELVRGEIEEFSL